MIGRQTLGGEPPTDPCRTAIGCLSAIALLCVSGCANIWGFEDLQNDSDGGTSGTGGADVEPGGKGRAGSGAGGALSSNANGGAPAQGGADAFAGSGGTSNPDPGGSGAAGAGVSGASGGAVDPGASGAGGAGVSGAGGGIAGSAGGTGAGGSGGVSGTSGGPSGGTSGVGAPGGGGSGGQPTTGCIAGRNQCVRGDLQTCSANGTWQSTGTSTRELLTNPDFEAGASGWMVFVAGGFPLIYAANGGGGDTPAIAAQSSGNLAWFAGYQPANDSLSQAVVVPADAASISVSFYYSVFTRETSAAENDVMDVELNAGTQTIALAHFSDNNPIETWSRFSMPLPTTLAGQTVTLRFHDTANANQLSSFYIDTVSLQVVACP